MRIMPILPFLAGMSMGMLLIIPIRSTLTDDISARTPVAPTATATPMMQIPTDAPSPTPTAVPTKTPLPTPLPSSTPTPTPTPAPAYPLPSWNDLMGWFEHYGSQYNVPAQTLRTIAQCESRMDAHAATSRYAGLFQFNASTWQATREAMGLDADPGLRFSAEESIRTAAFKIANGGIGAWPHCAH